MSSGVSVESKFQQIGNAVPPKLAESVLRGLISGENLISIKESEKNKQLNIFV